MKKNYLTKNTQKIKNKPSMINKIVILITEKKEKHDMTFLTLRINRSRNKTLLFYVCRNRIKS